ncbi:MAG: hypothetical protein Q9207_006685, partial [Kuettlingeria erythrocarpa]
MAIQAYGYHCFSFLLLARSLVASPIGVPAASPQHISKRTIYELYCPAVLPNPPPAPLVQSINMRVLQDRLENYGEFVLAYDDMYGETEWIYNSDQLCERVGCHCAGAEMICSIGGTLLYNAAIRVMFIDLCTSRCRCEPEYVEPPEPVSASDSDTDSTWSTDFSESESGSYYSEEAVREHFADTTARLRAQYDRGRNVDYVGAQPPPACVPNRLQR